jgi:CubicO group peptidase (beta-lactamase class C family)
VVEQRRRWPRRVVVGVGVVVVAIGGVYVWARLSTGRSTLARALIWLQADVGDQRRFPARPIPAGDRPSSLPTGPQRDLSVAGGPLDDMLRGTDTRAFVVVHRDRVVFERYDGGASARTLETSFSVAKSFVSTLVGIAIAQHRIASATDPVTDYLPELAQRDPRFRRITLSDLLSMRSGLRYRESGGPWPWGDDTYTYYGIDLRKEALERTRIEQPPAQRWHYNNYNPLLLGLVLERATGQSVSAYTTRALWRPLGAAQDASWSLDSERSQFEKLESGVNATARDYARFGLLFLHDGRFNGRRIVARAWVRAATRARTPTDYPNGYGYFWWIDGRRPGCFYAFGNYGQYVYVDPLARVVVVRLGSDWGYGNERWLTTFRAIADQLADERGQATAVRIARHPPSTTEGQLR